jgi:hypothetical protein
LLTFRNLDEAAAGVHAINGRYQHHRRAARELAETFFATSRALPQFLDVAMR